MISTPRNVCIILSSTFREFSQERAPLVREVLPELRRKCCQRKVEPVDANLRRSITKSETQ